ncbi:MAG: lipoate--protein ligase family protein [Candidatus Micrarchaeota archaeon]|nr:lipoate--protein ligase family protein [Candidatus Micrarchaeota archaeon]
MGVKWRVLPHSVQNAYLNMALDEAILNSVADGASPPTIRFYGWSPSAVSIGYFQSISDEVDTKYCNAHSIDIVRRQTGGGAVFHQEGGEITYSIIAPQEMFPAGIIDSYREICGGIVRGLGKLGITAEFRPINDITVHGRKISGNAQTRKKGVLLQHGTVLYTLNLPKMFTALKVSVEKLKDKSIKSPEDRVTCITRENPKITAESAYKALLEGFTDGKDWELGAPTPLEEAEANRLSKNKYLSNEWVFWR